MMAIMRESYRTPFDWNGLLAWLGARAIPGVESIDDNTYVRGDVRVWHERDAVHANAARKRVRRVFDLDADPTLIHAALGRDRMLAPLAHHREHVFDAVLRTDGRRVGLHDLSDGLWHGWRP